MNAHTISRGGSWVVSSSFTNPLRIFFRQHPERLQRLAVQCNHCHRLMVPAPTAKTEATDYHQWTLNAQATVKGTRHSGIESAQVVPGFATIFTRPKPYVLPCGDVICDECCFLARYGPEDPRSNLQSDVWPLGDLEFDPEDTFDATAAAETIWAELNMETLLDDEAVEDNLVPEPKRGMPLFCAAKGPGRSQRPSARVRLCMFDHRMHDCLPDCPGIMALPFPATLEEMDAMPSIVPTGEYMLGVRAKSAKKAHPDILVPEEEDGPWISDLCHRCRLFREAAEKLDQPNAELPLTDRRYACLVLDPTVTLDERYSTWEKESEEATQTYLEKVAMTPWQQPLGGATLPQGSRIIFRSYMLPCVCTKGEGNDAKEGFCALFTPLVEGDGRFNDYEMHLLRLQRRENREFRRLMRGIEDAAAQGRLDPDGSDHSSDFSNDGRRWRGEAREDCCFCRGLDRCRCPAQTCRRHGEGGHPQGGSDSDDSGSSESDGDDDDGAGGDEARPCDCSVCQSARGEEQPSDTKSDNDESSDDSMPDVESEEYTSEEESVPEDEFVSD